MQQTGQILKKAREEAGLSLHEVSLSLKISSRIIQAIEEADEKKLPAKTFLRGFVKSYANLLKLNEEHVLEVFYTEVGSTVPKLQTGETVHRRGETVDVSRPKPELREPVRKANEEDPTSQNAVASVEASSPTDSNAQSEIKNEKSFTAHQPNYVEPSLKPIDQNKSPKTAILTVVGVVLVILIISAKHIIDKYSKEAAVPAVETTTTDDSSPVVAEAPVTGIGSSNDAGAGLTQATTAETTPKDGLVENAATTAPTKVTDSNPLTKTIPAVAATQTPPAAPVTPVGSNEPKAGFPKVTVPDGKPIELIVEAMENVEIEYSSKNGKRSTIKLTPEQVHTFKSKDGLSVSISNGGAVNLILNGRDLGIPGDSGKSIKLSY